MESGNNELRMIDLKRMIQILSNELEKLDDDTRISFDDDFYWNILDEELYNVYQDPGNFTMGSLYDDWEFLNKVIMNERQFIDYDLYKLAALLKFLGRKELIGNCKK